MPLGASSPSAAAGVLRRGYTGQHPPVRALRSLTSHRVDFRRVAAAQRSDPDPTPGFARPEVGQPVSPVVATCSPNRPIRFLGRVIRFALPIEQ